MLHIIGQYRELFANLIVSKFDKPSLSNSESLNEDKPLSFKDALTNALDAGGISQDEAKDLLNRMDAERVENINYTKSAAMTLIKSFDVKWEWTWIKKGSLKDRLEFIANETKNGNFKKQQKVVKDKPKAQKPFDEKYLSDRKVKWRILEEVDTKETVGVITKGEYVEVNELMDLNLNLEKFFWIAKGNVNNDSFIKMMSKISEDSKTDKTLIPKIKKLIKEQGDYVTPFSYWELEDVFEDLWYENDWWDFDSYEMAELMWLFNNRIETQNDIKSGKMSLGDKMRILFDRNEDGTLQIEANWPAWERGMDFQTFESLSTDWANVLIENLWLWTLDEFSILMWENITLARETFQRALWSMIENGFTPAMLVQKWKIWEVAQNNIDKVKGDRETIENELKDFESRLVMDNQKDKDSTMTFLKQLLLPDGVWMSFLWWNVWFWVSYNLADLTRWFLDSLQLSTAWITFTTVLFKETLSKYNITIPVSLHNFIFPFTMPRKTFEWSREEIKTMFANEMDTAFDYTVYWMIAPWLLWIWWAISISNEETSTWILEMVEGLQGILEETKPYILEWKTVEEAEKAWLFKNSNDLVKDRLTYNQLLNSYNTATNGMDEADKKLFLDELMRSNLVNYNNYLNDNPEAQWINITSVWLGVLSLAWYGIIPFLTVGWEYKDTTWEKVNHNSKISEKVTSRTVDLNDKKTGFEFTEYNGHKVLSFNEDYLHQVSNRDGETNVVRENWKVYISWDLDNFYLNEYLWTNEDWKEEVICTLVIWWGAWKVKWNENLYRWTKEVNNISSDVKVSWTKLDSEFQVIDKSALNSTKDIRHSLDSIISGEIIDAPKTKWMRRLKQIIIENDWQNIDKVWDIFVLTLTDNSIAAYSKQKWLSNEYSTLKDWLKSINTESEKMIILDNFYKNSMEKSQLDSDWEWNHTIRNSESLKEYNKSRYSFFNSIWKKELPSMADNITKASRKFDDIYENKTNNPTYNKWKFNSVIVDSWNIWFSWTEYRNVNTKWSPKITWIKKFAWPKSLLSIWWEALRVEIQWEHSELIDNIPDVILIWYRNQFNSMWAKLNTLNDVKTFIKNKWNKSISIKTNAYLTKNAECLNESPELEILINNNTLLVNSTSEVYTAETTKVDLGIVIAKEMKKDDKKSKDKPKDEDAEVDSNIDDTDGNWNSVTTSDSGPSNATDNATKTGDLGWF